MSDLPNNLTLIGMPGSGKSTVGQLVAERLGWAFLDVDHEIERHAGMKLWQINEREGFDGLRRREEEAALALETPQTRRTVIAPGGSVVYSEPAMRHLREIGRVVYLHVPTDVLEARAGDLKQRGVLIRPGMTYGDLVAERDPLYRRHAHEVIECGNRSAPAVARSISLEP